MFYSKGPGRNGKKISVEKVFVGNASFVINVLDEKEPIERSFCQSWGRAHNALWGRKFTYIFCKLDHLINVDIFSLCCEKI